MIIIVSGTPGTGKTTISKKLAASLGFTYVDVNKLIKKHSLEEKKDKERDCSVIDTKKLNKVLIDETGKGDQVIDSHLSHHLPKKYADICLITKAGLKELEKRLKKRGYSDKKIRENLDCEIFDVCLNEAREKKHNISVIDTTSKPDIESIISHLGLR